MATIAEVLMGEVKTRLVAIPDATTRRDHLTPTLRDFGSVINLEMGDDRPEKITSCEEHRLLKFDVCVVVRSDAVYDVSDPLVLAVHAALNPGVDGGYSFGARLTQKEIRRPKPDIADKDALEVKMSYEFRYVCAQWALDKEGPAS